MFACVVISSILVWQRDAVGCYFLTYLLSAKLSANMYETVANFRFLDLHHTRLNPLN